VSHLQAEQIVLVTKEIEEAFKTLAWLGLTVRRKERWKERRQPCMAGPLHSEPHPWACKPPSGSAVAAQLRHYCFSRPTIAAPMACPTFMYVSAFPP